MKKLILLLLLLLVLCAGASAQNPVWPYIFNGVGTSGNGYTCGPVTSCINYVYIPQGWYGSVSEGAAATCTYLYPWAPPNGASTPLS